jgi:tripartite-type tricarboxylate transporter receptor subunit TctC
VTGGARLAAHPEIPTFAEAGPPRFDPTSWNGLLAPKGTPVDVLARLNGAGSGR